MNLIDSRPLLDPIPDIMSEFMWFVWCAAYFFVDLRCSCGCSEAGRMTRCLQVPLIANLSISLSAKQILFPQLLEHDQRESVGRLNFDAKVE